MHKKTVSHRKLVPKLQPGSVVEIILAPGYYTYARKAEGLSSFAFYDILSEEPLTDLAKLVQQPILLTVPMLMPEATKWPVIGCLPLQAGWTGQKQYWKAEPQPLLDEQSKTLVFQPNTDFFLVTYTAHEPIYTPAIPDNLRGLPRQSLYPPDFIEDKLRRHYGLTPQGERVPSLPLKKQPLW